MRITYSFIVLFSIGLFSSCFSPTNKETKWDFDNIPNRIWISSDFWTVPIENWEVNDGKLHAKGNEEEVRNNILTYGLTGNGNMELTVDMGFDKLQSNEKLGVRLAVTDPTDNDIKSLCYYNSGIDVGVNGMEYFFIQDKKVPVPRNFSFESFKLHAIVKQTDTVYELTAKFSDKLGNEAIINKSITAFKGAIAVFKSPGSSNFWMDNLKLAGSMVEHQPENAFGPILFNMYTLSRKRLKMSVQMPPLSMDDEQELSFQLLQGDEYKTVAKTTIRKPSCIGLFEINNWADSINHNYRIVYNEKRTNGTVITSVREGVIPANPENGQLKMAGLTCQQWHGYPYKPLVESLAEQNPDLLYFSGDQIYESNGGYDIYRDRSPITITNYLGKWYMFGWAFGDIMKNRPTICIPDDHEVYQGNLWGNGGDTMSIETWKKFDDDKSGFVQPLDMIKVVMETNSAHLPDPYDATPMKNGIPVYYTDILYGGVSFAIVGDRVFKSGPENISWWKGRKDHIKSQIDVSKLENDKLSLLGKRQLDFLNQWVYDWKGANLKCVLTQTIFGNTATHHGGEQMYLIGDMDSGGWPKNGRDKALEAFRKAGALHICGDQHLTSLQKYGIQQQYDAGWVFCTPAISVGYERRFKPDWLNTPAVNRPEHNLPNTGEYSDVFGNYFYMYAVGNPIDSTEDENRYQMVRNRASGYGMINFNTHEFTIDFDAIRFPVANTSDSLGIRFAGWPYQITSEQNLGTHFTHWLPKLIIHNETNPVVEVYDENTSELVYCFRFKGTELILPVYKKSTYRIKVGFPEKDKWKEINRLQSEFVKGESEVEITF